MLEKFIIEGGHKLEGEIEVRGSKNAAGAIVAACLLTQEECIIDNVPLVRDILGLLDLLKGMGVEVEFIKKRKVRIKAGRGVDVSKIDFEKFSRARTAVLLIGALLTRFNEFKVSRPGGDRIGLRPITTHLRVLEKLGADIKEEGEFYYFKVDTLKGTKIVLPEFSVTATENLIMAASLAKGKTVIKIAAQEPHVQDLVDMLNKMGANIKWEKDHTLIVRGVEKLKGVKHKIIPDPIEAGTFIVMGAVTEGRVLVKNIRTDHFELFLDKLEEIGVEMKITDDSVEVFTAKKLRATRLQALPYPGFPTDLMPIVVPLLTQAKGKSLIHDPLYESRLNYTHQLRKMGADIEIVDPHRAFVFGPSVLTGVTIESWDIRAGASLVVAALMAKGRTTINNIDQIDRGYEQIEIRLKQLGADIKRVKS